MKIEFPPRGPWARLPTPVQKLERISAELGTEIWIKRDDQTGFEVSGNKIRKLEFLVQDALAKGATALITCGGIQSNHCRATAALAARLGLRCILLLRGTEPEAPTSNLLLDKLFGAEIFYLTPEQYYEGMDEFRRILESQLRNQGTRAYFIPEGGSNALGCYGYALAFREIEEQQKSGELPADLDSIVFAHGSGGTQAGLVLGTLVSENPDCPAIVGVNVCYDAKKSYQLVKDALWQAIQQHRLPLSFLAEDIQILDGFRGRGYALTSTDELRFLARVARLEGVLLDPVYTGKAFLGLYQTAKNQAGRLGKRVLFLHTGGGFGNFQLEKEWKEALSP